jgi:CRISPR-associated endonuclease Cas1
MLGYGYALLASEVVDWITALGYEPSRGFYHEPRAGRPALALDLMEPYRHEIIDRLVQRLVNLQQIKDSDFRPGPNGGIWLKPAAARKLVGCHEQLMAGQLDREPGPREILRRRIAEHLEQAFGDATPTSSLDTTPTLATEFACGVSSDGD